MFNAKVQLPASEEWIPCEFLGLIHEESGDLVAIVRVNGELLLKMVHPSRIRISEVPYYER